MYTTNVLLQIHIMYEKIVLQALQHIANARKTLDLVNRDLTEDEVDDLNFELKRLSVMINKSNSTPQPKPVTTTRPIRHNVSQTSNQKQVVVARFKKWIDDVEALFKSISSNLSGAAKRNARDTLWRVLMNLPSSTAVAKQMSKQGLNTSPDMFEDLLNEFHEIEDIIEQNDVKLDIAMPAQNSKFDSGYQNQAGLGEGTKVEAVLHPGLVSTEYIEGHGYPVLVYAKVFLM